MFCRALIALPALDCNVFFVPGFLKQAGRSRPPVRERGRWFLGGPGSSGVPRILKFEREGGRIVPGVREVVPEVPWVLKFERGRSDSSGS